jgi:hypothetical protein
VTLLLAITGNFFFQWQGDTEERTMQLSVNFLGKIILFQLSFISEKEKKEQGCSWTPRCGQIIRTERDIAYRWDKVFLLCLFTTDLILCQVPH